MDKAMAADLDKYLTTEPSGPVEYDVFDVPVIRSLVTMYVDGTGGPLGLVRPYILDEPTSDGDKLREHIYRYYQANEMANSLFSVGWEAGVERQPMRIVEADELNEGDEIDDDGEARFYYLHGYVAGQLATYEDWGTPYTKDSDDEFFDEMSEEG